MIFFKKSENRAKDRKPGDDIEKIKKDLRFIGITVCITGLVTVVDGVGFYIWSLFDENLIRYGIIVDDMASVSLKFLLAVSFIILGNRIRICANNGAADKIKLYLQILIAGTSVFALYFLLTGGRVGLIIYLILLLLVTSFVLAGRMIKLQKLG